MKPDTIIIHCSATKVTSDVPVSIISEWHRARGYKSIGYHYYVRKDGAVEKGRREDEQGAHCKGRNSRSIGICYEGGLDADGSPADTRTPSQRMVILRLIRDIESRHTIKSIIGHRDASPDLDGDGTIEEDEWTKECPCFDVACEYGNLTNG